MPRAAKTADGLTEKQRRFVEEYLKTGSASAAYRIAYNAKGMKPATVNNKAHQLLKNGEIGARIAEHQKQARERLDVSLDTLTEALIADRAAARVDRRHSAAIAATMALAELHGFKVDPRQNARRPFEDWTEAQLDAEIARLAPLVTKARH
jgi:hypothetical protein